MERLTISGGKISFYNEVYNKCSNQDAPHIKKQLDEGKKTYEIEGYEYKSYSTTELKAIYARLAELEDRLESGHLVEMPIKVGDTIYLPYLTDWGDIEHYTVIEVGIDTNEGWEMWFVVDDEDGERHYFEEIGRDCFLTKTQAEACLEK